MLRSEAANGLRLLARQGPMTDDDWYKQLEERRNLLAPAMRDMSLKSLGDLKIVGDDLHKLPNGRPIRNGRMVQTVSEGVVYREAALFSAVKGDFPLETRGIFPNDDVYYNGHFKWDFIRPSNHDCPTGETIRFWGLTRNNQWILAEATLSFFTQREWNKDRKRSELKNLDVRLSSAFEICQYGWTPQWLWKQLGEEVRRWHRHRESLLAEAKRLERIVKQEEQIIALIEEKK